MTSTSAGPDGASQRRAELRQYVGAYFAISGWLTAVATVLQLATVALATLSALRLALQPLTNWFVLGFALVTPFARSFGEEAKRTADGILRRLEIWDALDIPVPPHELEKVREDALVLVDVLAQRQDLDFKPYASDVPAGPARLVENVRQSAWWSARLARENGRWEGFWACVLIVTCVGALYHFATSVPTTTAAVSAARTRDVAEFAATLLVFVFAEGFLRRSREFKAFAFESDRVVERAEHLRAAGSTPSAEDALPLAMDYYLARQASPRLSTIWYRIRKARLNAKWDSVHADDRGRLA